MLQKRRQMHFYDRDVTEPLAEAQEKRMLIAFKLGDYEAREELICRNLRLVYYICKKFSNTNFEVADLISIGTIGLIKGLDTYDLQKDIKLATYVSRCIENEILMYIRSERKGKDNVSLDELLTVDWEGNELTLQDTLKVEEDNYKRYENMEEVANILECILNSLKTREKLVVLLKLADVSQKEIGIEFGISQSYISRVIQNAQKKVISRLKKSKADRYSIKVVKDKYRVSVNCTEKQAKEIKERLKEKVIYEYGKISIDSVLGEEMYKLLASLVKLLEK